MESGSAGNGETAGVEITGDFVHTLMNNVCSILDKIPAYVTANKAALAATNNSGRAATAVFPAGDIFYKLHHGDHGNYDMSFTWLTLSTFDSLEAARSADDRPTVYVDISNDVALSNMGDVDYERPKLVYEDSDGRHETDAEALRKTWQFLGRLSAMQEL